MPSQDKPILGWREWVALPTLGIPAVKAKLDTGARTSALHAFEVQTYAEGGVSRVKFGIHPVQKRTDIEVFCEADLIDERVVTDSGGHREARLFIRTAVQVGAAVWDIEISLTNRDDMKFRMLLGRTALAGQFLVDPQLSYQTGRALAKSYRRPRRKRKRSQAK